MVNINLETGEVYEDKIPKIVLSYKNFDKPYNGGFALDIYSKEISETISLMKIKINIKIQSQIEMGIPNRNTNKHENGDRKSVV